MLFSRTVASSGLSVASDPSSVLASSSPPCPRAFPSGTRNMLGCRAMNWFSSLPFMSTKSELESKLKPPMDGRRSIPNWAHPPDRASTRRCICLSRRSGLMMKLVLLLGDSMASMFCWVLAKGRGAPPAPPTLRDDLGSRCGVRLSVPPPPSFLVLEPEVGDVASVDALSLIVKLSSSMLATVGDFKISCAGPGETFRVGSCLPSTLQRGMSTGVVGRFEGVENGEELDQPVEAFTGERRRGGWGEWLAGLGSSAAMS